MSKRDINVSVGGGFFGTLTIVFIVLKILGFITWPWLMVFSPIFVPLSILFLTSLFCLFLAFLSSL